MNTQAIEFSQCNNRDILRVENIWKRLGGCDVLRGVSFSLKEREILGIIGPSGGGKTTLLRCLNLLTPIDKGQITYHHPHNMTVTAKEDNGLKITDLNSSVSLSVNTINMLRQNIGFVFQGFNLWEDRNVLSNLILAPIVVLKNDRDIVEKRAQELCRQFGLEGKIKAKVAELSGGQRQRVAIIRALMMNPQLMLLDEITSALDPVLTLEVMQAIRKLREKGLAMILVTHHLEFASVLCDRIMFLSHGEAIQIASPDELRSTSISEEVKQFLEVLRTAR